MASKLQPRRKEKPYKSNLKTSFRELGKAYIKTQMPIIGDLTVSSQSALNAFRTGIFRNKNKLKTGFKAQRMTMRSYVGATYANLKQDLKSGKIYNIDRLSENLENTALGGMMNSYLDDEGGAATEFGRGSADDAVYGGLRDTGEVITGSVDYLGELMTSQTVQNSITAQQRHMEQMRGFGNMTNLLKSQLDFHLNEMNNLFDASTAFYDSTQQQLNSIIEEIHTLNQRQAERYGDDQSTGSGGLISSVLEQVFSSSGLNVKEYLNVVKKNAKNKSGILGGLGMVAQQGLGEFKANPLGTLLKGGLGLATSKAMKKSMGRLNTAVGGLGASYLMGMERLKTSENPLFRMLGEVFGVDMRAQAKPNTASYKNEKLTLQVENKKNKAITEVIPQYLSAITKKLTGIDKAFDYDKGIFVDRTQRKKENTKIERDSAVASMSESRQYMSNNLYKIEGNMSSREKKIYQEDLDTFIYFLATLGTNVKPETLTYDYCTKRGLELVGGKQSFTMMMALYKSLSKTQKTAMRSEQIQAIQALRDTRARMDTELNFSGGMSDFNRFYDGTPNTSQTDNGSPTKSKGRRTRATRVLHKKDSNRPLTAEDLRGMSTEEILESINASTETGTRPKNDSGDLGTAAARAASEQKAKFMGKMSKLFSLKDHKILNSLFGEDGMFPGIMNQMSDGIADVIYGDGKEKGIFGTIFGGVRETFNTKIDEIKTVIQGKFGESKLYKALWGDKKSGELGLFGETKKLISDNLISPIKGAIMPKLKGFYDKYLKSHMDKLSSEAKKYKEKATTVANQAYDEATGNVLPKDKPSTQQQEQPQSGPKKYKVKGGMIPRQTESTSVKSATAKVAKVTGASAKQAQELIQKVKIVGGQKGLPVLVQYATSKAAIIKTSPKDGPNLPYERAGATGGEVKGLPARAKGGRVKKGTVFTVGENGPEKLVATTDLTVFKHGEAVEYKSNQNQSGGGEQPGPKIDLQKLFGDIKNKTKENGGGIAGMFQGIKEKFKEFQDSEMGFKSPVAGAAVSSLLGLGPLPGLFFGALLGKKKNLDKKKEKEAREAGIEIQKSQLQLKLEKVKELIKGPGIGAIASSMLGLGPMPGLIIGALIANKKKKKQEMKDAEAKGEQIEKTQQEGKLKSLIGKFKGAAIGGVVSSMLGLGPMPGLIIGGIISNRRRKKKEEAEAKKQGEAVGEAQKDESKKGGLFAKFKGAAIGGVASTLLGLGPMPGIIIGSLLANRKRKKKELDEAQKMGEQVDGQKKQGFFGKLKGFFKGLGRGLKKAGGAAAGAVISTMLGLGPLPGALIGWSMTSKKLKKKDEEEAKKAAEATEGGENQEKKKGFFGRTIDKFKGLFKRKGQGDPNDPNSQTPSSQEKKKLGIGSKVSGLLGKGKELISGAAKGVKGMISSPKSSDNKSGSNPGPKSQSQTKEQLRAERAEKKKQKQEERMAARQAKQTQRDTKKALRNARNGKGGDAVGEISKSLDKADTSRELSGTSQSAGIVSDAMSLTKKDGSDIKLEGVGGGSETTNGLLGGILGLLGGASLGSVIKNFGLSWIKGKVKGGVKKFVKNNASDAYSVAQIARGSSMVKEGVAEMKEGDTISESTGSAKVVRGAANVTSGTAKVAGTVVKAAQGVATGTKSKSLIGKITQFMVKMFKKLSSKIADKAAGKMIAKSASKLASTAVGKFASKIAIKAASFIAKWSNVIGWAIVIAQAVYDFGTGMADVKNIMGLAPDFEPTIGLRVTAGICKALSGFLLGLIPVDFLTSLVYGIIGDKEEKQKIVESQEKQKKEYQQFIKDHPEAAEKGLTEEKYNEIQNKSTWTKMKEGFLGLFGKKKSSLDDYTNEGSSKAYQAAQTNNITIVNSGDSGSGGRGIIISGRGGKQSVKDILANVANTLTGTSKLTKPSQKIKTEGRGVDLDGRGFLSKIADTVKGWFGKKTSTDKNEEGSVQESSADYRAVKSVPYYSQLDDKWRTLRYGRYNGLPDTIGAGGCGPTTAAMMFEGLTGVKQDVVALAGEADKLGYKHNGTSAEFFRYLGEKYGIPIDTKDSLTGDAINKLNKKVPIALVGKNDEGKAPFGPSPHYVLATHANDRGINIYDPMNPDNNKRYSTETIAEDIQKAIIPDISGEASGARGSVKIPVAKTRSALAKKNDNKVKSSIATATSTISQSRGRGPQDDPVTKLCDIATAILDVIKTMSESITAIEENSAKMSADVTVSSDGSSITQASSSASYSSKADSVNKGNMYNKAVTA